MADPRYQDLSRFKREHGFPKGRGEISTKDLTAEGKYTLLRKLVPIGTGGLNEGIDLVRNTTTNRRYVQKSIDPTLPALVRELLLIQVLDHPNIIRYKDAFVDKSAWNHHRASLYMEFCCLGSAKDLLEKYHKRNKGKEEERWVYIPEAFIWHVFRSMALALQYLHHGIHSIGGEKRDVKELAKMVRGENYCRDVWPMIMHRDIKPENIFFRKEQPVWGSVVRRRKVLGVVPVRRKGFKVFPRYPRVILGDFGLALQYNDPDWNPDRDYIGTYHWMPPELPQHYAQSDIWAVGAVILALCRQLPHGVVKPPPADWTQGDEAWSKHRDARKGIRDHGVGKYYSPELNQVVHECLRFNRVNRPLSFELLKMIEEGERRAGERAWLECDMIPRWVWGGAEDRLHRRKEK